MKKLIAISLLAFTSTVLAASGWIQISDNFAESVDGSYAISADSATRVISADSATRVMSADSATRN